MKIYQIINKITYKYLRDDVTFNSEIEEGIDLPIPTGFIVNDTYAPSYNSISKRWEGTLYPGWELNLDGFPQLSSASYTEQLIKEVEYKINEEFSRRAKAVKNGYPLEEIDSWPKQEQEARNYIIDPVNADVSLITEIASYRNMTLSDFANAVITKANLYSSIIGPIIGRRKTLVEDLPNKTDQELENYDVATEWGP